MFETSVFVGGQRMSRRRRLVLLPLSVLVHAAVISAAIGVATWTVDLPAQAPPQIQAYQTVTPVPPPPPPPAPSEPPADQPRPPVQVEPPRAETVPQRVPEKTPELPAPQDAGPTTGNQDGVVGGVDNGQQGGQAGGVVTSPQRQQPPLAPIVITAEVEPPKILHRVAPVYPELARRARATGTVIVQCVIDRTGALRDIRVLSVPNPWLDQAAIDAVSQWRFSPGKLRGNPVDVYFTLTVRFDLGR